MIGVVIVTHGKLGAALLSTAELIMGKQHQVLTVAFESGQAVGDLQSRIMQAVEQVDDGQGVLIMVDLLGGSPYNAAAMLAMQEPRIKMITGVNLPMLFEALPLRSSELSILADIALYGGRDGIDKFGIDRKNS